MDVLKKIEWLKREVEELEEELEKQEEKSNNVWKPKEGEDMYVLCGDGNITCFTYDGDLSCQALLAVGNAFKTKLEARFMVERLNVIKELKQYARPFKKDQYNYYIYYNYIFNEVRVEFSIYNLDNNLYFKSEKAALKAIEEIGEERIKKYYFKVYSCKA